MATVLGFDPAVYKKFTCRCCAAIVRYLPQEIVWDDQTDEGEKILGLNCPNCQKWHRTNP